MAGAHIALLDLDAFYLGVERVVDPSLRGKPAAVGGGAGDRGVILSASYEARAAGVRSGMPLGQARRRCPELTMVSPNHKLYTRASRAVFRLVARHAPSVEQVSVDEAYLDLSGTGRLSGTPLDAAAELQRAIRERFRLDVTVGLAATKIVAKVAAGLVKPRGVLDVAPGREARFLAPLAVGRLPGIGPVTRRRLEELGLHTLGDLQRAGPDALARGLGRVGPGLVRRAHGADGQPVRRRGRRSIGHQRTFPRDVVALDELQARLRGLLQEGMWRMRSAGYQCRTVEVELRFADFVERSRHRTLARPTDIDAEVLAVADELLRRLHGRRVAVRRLGVRFSNLTPGVHQLALVEPEQTRDRRRELLRAVDRIRERHGAEAIGYAGATRLGTRVAATPPSTA